MKRIVSGIVAAMMVLAVNGAALAEEEGTTVSAGIKTWINTVKDESGGTTDTSKNAFLIGPAVEAEFSNHLFVEGSYLMTTTDYRFSDGTEVSRNDINLALGYMFLHHAGVYAGYREEAFKLKGTAGTDAKVTDSGPIFGVRGSVPVNESLSLYGDLAYLLLDSKLEAGGLSVTEKAPGWEVEAGVQYAFNSEIEGNLGYKYESTKGKDSGDKDTFTGLTLGIKYNF